MLDIRVDWYTVEECGPGLYRYVYREGDMTEHTRFRIEDDLAPVRRGCLLALTFCCFFWAAVVVAVALWRGWL